MTKIVVFGRASHAVRVLHELHRSNEHEVVGNIESAAQADPERFDKAEVSAFVCGDQTHLNQDRLSAYMAVRQLGYRVVAVASAASSVAASVRLRDNVFIDRDVRVLEGANIGANCWVMSGAGIGAGVRMGSSCWIASGCRIGDGASLGKNCTLGPGVVIAAGVVLPAWSTINEPMVIKQSPASPIFIDSLFRAPVSLRGH